MTFAHFWNFNAIFVSIFILRNAIVRFLPKQNMIYQTGTLVTVLLPC